MISLQNPKHHILLKRKNLLGMENSLSVLIFLKIIFFFVQDAIQSHHWTNTQATIHPYVVYYRENEEMKHVNNVIISEKVCHDASSVHLFNFKLIEFLKITELLLSIKISIIFQI